MKKKKKEEKNWKYIDVDYNILNVSPGAEMHRVYIRVTEKNEN